MALFCFIAGLVILGVAIFFAFKNRYSASKWIGCLLVGIFLYSFVTVLPTVWVKDGKVVSYPTLFSVASSLFYGLKSISGGQDLYQPESASLPAALKFIYVLISYIVFITSPILASGLLISFFGDKGDMMRYIFRRSRECAVFSEVNENSLALAKGVRESGVKTIVFCNSKGADRDLAASAKSRGGILLYKHASAMKIARRYKKYTFYLISDDGDRNIEQASGIAKKCEKLTANKVTVNVFAESGTDVELLEEIYKKLNKETDRAELRCIDEAAFFCDRLIYDYPLYDTKGHGKNISAAIIGCGRTGTDMLKSVYRSGIIEGYTLKITVFDKAASRRRGEFIKACPGLASEERIRFVDADALSEGFDEKLLEYVPDATYVVAATNDDGQNLAIADYVYRVFRRKSGFTDEGIPEIFARVRSKRKITPYTKNEDYAKRRSIHLFGTADSVYSHNILFNTELERLALGVHLAYSEMSIKKGETLNFEAARREFVSGEYNRRSSIASALHIPSKLQAYKDDGKVSKNVDDKELIALYKEKMKDDAEVLRMAKNEHERWIAYMLTEGYVPATDADLAALKKNVGRDKDKFSRVHACLTDWDSLEAIEKAFNEDFRSYDFAIVKKLPDIIEYAEK